jgi:hypothetical protein
VNGMTGIIDRSGNWVVEPVYLEIFDFEETRVFK